MKIFGHEFGKKAEAPVQPAVETQAVDAVAETAPTTPEVVDTIDAKVTAALGSAGAELSAEVAEAEANGTLDVAHETSVPASVEVVAEEIANLPEIAEPVTPEDTGVSEQPVVETFTVPQATEEAPISDQVEVEGVATPQEVVPAPTIDTPTPEITVDPVQDAAPAEGSDDLWKEFNATAPVESAEASNPGETQQ